MLPDKNEELEYDLLDARTALRRIRKVLELEKEIPLCSFGYDQLATAVENYVNRIKLEVLKKQNNNE